MFSMWKAVFLVGTPTFTTPSWGGELPFTEVISTFTPDRPEMDCLQMQRRLP